MNRIPIRTTGSYGYEADDKCWWYENGYLHVVDGELFHHHIMPYEDYAQFI